MLNNILEIFTYHQGWITKNDTILMCICANMTINYQITVSHGCMHEHLDL